MNIVRNHDIDPLIKSLMRPDHREILQALDRAVRQIYSTNKHEGVRAVLHMCLGKERPGSIDIAMILTTCLAISIETLKTVDIGIEMANRQNGEMQE